MSGPHYIFDATPDNFDALVLDNSMKGPDDELTREYRKRLFSLIH
ncbi:MAG: hypothetical protein PVF75_06685 [Granulosicoccaceae bacterium]|jgi:hypothetical protein